MGILASGATGSVAVLGAVLCGCGIGAEIDIMGFMLSRYFGMRNYGKIYGIIFAAFVSSGFVGDGSVQRSFCDTIGSEKRIRLQSLRSWT